VIESADNRFARVVAASGFSNLADGIAKLAIPLIAVRFTRSPFALGALGFTLSVPWLLLALHAGALADRIDRRKIMLFANSARALVAALLALALLLGWGSLALLYVAAILTGVAEVFYDTSSQSLLPQIIPADDLPKANSRLLGVETIANQMIGPALGGVLVGAAAALATGTPAVLWVLAVAALFTVRGSYRPDRVGPAMSLTADIREGLRYLTGHRVLRTLALMTGGSNFSGSMTGAVFVLFAVGPYSRMGLTDGQFGVFSAVFAVGALIGSAFADRIVARFGRARSLGFAVIASVLVALFPALTNSPWAIGSIYLNITCSNVQHISRRVHKQKRLLEIFILCYDYPLFLIDKVRYPLI